MSIRNGWHYNDERDEYYLYEDASKIPITVCLYFAHAPTECMCGCTSWLHGDDYYEWDELFTEDDYD